MLSPPPYTYFTFITRIGFWYLYIGLNTAYCSAEFDFYAIEKMDPAPYGTCNSSEKSANRALIRAVIEEISESERC